MKNIDKTFLGFLKNSKNYKLCSLISYLLFVVSTTWFILLSITLTSEYAVASKNMASIQSVLNKELITSMDDDGIHTSLNHDYSYEDIKGYTSVLPYYDYYYMPDDSTVSVPMMQRDVYYNILSCLLAYFVIVLAISMVLTVQHGKKKIQNIMLKIFLAVEIFFMFMGIWVFSEFIVNRSVAVIVEISTIILAWVLQSIVININNANRDN